MPSILFRIKRRLAGGAAGAPAALKTGEPAYNEQDDTLYYGKGDDGAGNATSVITIGGRGAFLDKTTNQTLSGVKTFASSPIAPTPATADNSTQLATTAYVKANLSGTGAGDMTKAVYDTNNDGKVDSAATADNALSLGGSLANLYALKTYVDSAIANLVASSPAALDTLNELAAALGNDANFAATTSTNLGLKMVKTANLSDVASVLTARTNLGLGTMATQNANAVAITGGSIDNIQLDAGVF